MRLTKFRWREVTGTQRHGVQCDGLSLSTRYTIGYNTSHNKQINKQIHSARRTNRQTTSKAGLLRSLISNTIAWSNPEKKKISSSPFSHPLSSSPPVRYFLTSPAPTIWSSPLNTTQTCLPSSSFFHSMFSVRGKCLGIARDISKSRPAKYHSSHCLRYEGSGRRSCMRY